VRVRQILLNYLSNAAKFAPRGEIVVRTEATRAGPDAVLIHLSVQDSGIGIPADRMGKLFGAFSQVDDSARRAFDGSGLGLAITKRLAELMGGSVWAESEEGKGSTFHVTFKAGVPVKMVAPAPDASPATPAVAPNAPLPEKALRILVAEDNVVNRKVILALLRRLGYAADIASNGEEALVAARRSSYDVILMDVQMPVLDGLEATRRLREEHSAATCPRIVALTAGVLPEERQHCFDAGMDEFLTKPVASADLVAALERCRERRATAEAAEAGGAPGAATEA
jgi:CheY-like chemotaxis protein